MSRHLVRTFLLATAFSSVVTAGPCRPRPTSASTRIESLTQSVSSSAVLIDTETVSHSDTVSQDASTGTGASINPTDVSLTFSNTYSISTATTEDIDVSTDWYPYLPISTVTYGDGTSSTVASISSAIELSSTTGSESFNSHATDISTPTVGENEASSAISTDTTATSSDATIETQPTLSAATDTTSTGSETQSISVDTTATSGEADASATIGTETITSVAIDTTVGTSGTDSSLAPSSDTTTASGESSSSATPATSTDTTETSKAAETTTTTSDDLSTTGTNSPTSTTKDVTTDTTITSSETTATSSQTDTTATTETGTSTATTETTSSDTTVISKETDTTIAISSEATTGPETLTSTTETASTDTTATSGETRAITSENSNPGNEASSTSEASSRDTTVTTKDTDTRTTTSGDLTTTTTSGFFTSTTATTSTDATVTTTGIDTSGTTTSSGPTSTLTDTFTSTTEATTDTTLTSSETDTPPTTTSGDLTTTETASLSSTREASSTTSETSTAALPVCTPGHLISPKPPGLDCGKRGFPLQLSNQISWEDGQGLLTIDACSKACMKKPECESIIFQEGEACEFWKGKPGKTDNTNTDFGWYDMDCFCEETLTEPEPTCTNNLNSPAPANKICGKTGYAGYTYTGQGPTNSLEACAKACKSNNQCTSFNFEVDNACFLFSGALGERNGLPTTWMLYELDCLCDLDKPDPEPEPQNGCKLKSPLPQNKFCGVTGYATGTNIDFVRDGPKESREACAEACKSEAQCTHFHFQVNNRCALLSGVMTATDGQDLGSQWYDRDCFFCSSDEPEPNVPTQPEPTCKNNIVNPIPAEMVCGEKGNGDGVYHKGPGPNGSSKSLQACAGACITSDECTFFQFKADQECEFYVGRLGNLDGTQTSYKWYGKDCFCDLDKTEPTEPEITPEPETTCKNNIISPIPENRWCGTEGEYYLASGGASPPEASRSLWACANACKSEPSRCGVFKFEAGKECSFFVGGMISSHSTTANSRWYDRNCFCDLDKPEHNGPETNPPEPEPQCVNNALQPSPKDSACGAMGNPTTRGREEIGSATATSLQGCRDACHKDADCDSFQLEEGFNCYLFKGKVGSTDGRTTAEVWYDMSCFCGLEAQPTDPGEEDVCVDEVHKTQVCGLEGRPMYECMEDVTENSSDPELIKSLDACKAHCKSVGCDSIAFKKDWGCAVFKGRLGGMEADNTFPGLKWYDMSCFDEEPQTEEPTKDVCIGEPLNPLPANTVCGKPGDVDTNALSNKRLKTDVTLAECYKACKDASDCDVFNFHNQRCELYKTKSQFSGASVAFTGSTIQWWQPSCFCDDAKTDPKDPEPVCVNNMLSPAPKNSNCGATGSILTQGLSLDIHGFGDETSLKACSDSCKAFDGCESFSFVEQNFCIFFAASAGPTDGSATEHAYYDMSCFCDSNYATGD